LKLGATQSHYLGKFARKGEWGSKEKRGVGYPVWHTGAKGKERGLNLCARNMSRFSSTTNKRPAGMPRAAGEKEKETWANEEHSKKKKKKRD